MNAKNSVTQIALDRLVDGELDDAEYQQLIEQLEHDPDGWRRCAATFLEAQAWSRTFDGLYKSAIVSEAKTALPRVDCRGTPWSPLTLAAGILFAFGSGFLANQWLPVETRPSEMVVQQDDVPSEDDASVMTQAIASNDDPQTRSDRTELVEVATDEYGKVDLDLNAVYHEQEAEYEQFLREMEARGHVVRRYYGQLPVKLQDGREGTLPVEEFEIVPVRGDFQ